jgi:rod shape-determining protein MreD
MVKVLKIFAVFAVALLLQVTVFPSYLADPFKPNLLIVIVACLGLRVPGRLGACLAYSLGFVQDCFSGLYLGLSGFSYLCIFLLLRKIADRLYTNSRYLLVVVVFLATIVNGLLHLVLLFLFATADGTYATLLPALVPQGLVNALISSFIFTLPSFNVVEESR